MIRWKPSRRIEEEWIAKSSSPRIKPDLALETVQHQSGFPFFFFSFCKCGSLLPMEIFESSWISPIKSAESNSPVPKPGQGRCLISTSPLQQRTHTERPKMTRQQGKVLCPSTIRLWKQALWRRELCHSGSPRCNPLRSQPAKLSNGIFNSKNRSTSLRNQ